MELAMAVVPRNSYDHYFIGCTGRLRGLEIDEFSVFCAGDAQSGALSDTSKGGREQPMRRYVLPC